MVVSKALLPRKKGGIWGEVSWDSHEKALLKHQTPMTFFLVPPKKGSNLTPKDRHVLFLILKGLLRSAKLRVQFSPSENCVAHFFLHPPQFFTPKFSGKLRSSDPNHWNWLFTAVKNKASQRRMLERDMEAEEKAICKMNSTGGVVLQ